MRKIFFCLCLLPALVSCSHDRGLANKLVGRMNALEVEKASFYVYEGDYPKMLLYNHFVESCSPQLHMHIIDKENIRIDGMPAIVATIECKNYSQMYKQYMQSAGLWQKEGIIRDTMRIMDTKDGRRLSFDWCKINGDNLLFVSISSPSQVRKEPSTQAELVTSLSCYVTGVADRNDMANGFVKCFFFSSGEMVSGYVPQQNVSGQKNSTPFYALTWWQYVGILFGIVLFIGVAVPFFLLRSAIEVFSGSPQSWIVILGAILGVLYCLYQLLEMWLFELFLINLPY